MFSSTFAIDSQLQGTIYLLRHWWWAQKGCKLRVKCAGVVGEDKTWFKKLQWAVKKMVMTKGKFRSEIVFLLIRLNSINCFFLPNVKW